MKSRKSRLIGGICMLLMLAIGDAGVSANPSATGSSKADDISVLWESIAQDRLFDVDVRGDRWVAVGGAGLVLRSEDGGVSWQEEASVSRLSLLGVSFSGERIIAVGQQGLIMLSDGHGEWRAVDSGTSERLLDVSANEAGFAVAVGAFGTVLASSDRGDSWRRVSPDWAGLAIAQTGSFDRTGALDEPTIFGVHVLDDGKVLIAGELAYILRSTDGARSWSLVNRGSMRDGEVPPTLHAVHMRRDGTGFAAGQQGLVYRTVDGGLHWSIVQTPVKDANILSVISTPDGLVLGVGMRVAIRSHDDGRSWTTVDALDLNLNWYSALAAEAAGGRIITVGHSARILTLH
jgi:photosystem II stability/assembly factor-like uncharacterized protein